MSLHYTDEIIPTANTVQSACWMEKSMFIQSQKGEKGRFRHCPAISSKPCVLVSNKVVYCTFQFIYVVYIYYANEMTSNVD